MGTSKWLKTYTVGQENSAQISELRRLIWSRSKKYARAAEGLAKPSSAARALFSGAKHIERVDCLIQRIANQQGLQSDTVDKIVDLVDERLGKNRAATA